jgi:hypothetical protein
MTSKIIGTVYRTPNNSGQFASGRGAIYSISQLAPTIITMGGGGNKPHIPIRRVVRDEESDKDNG